MNTFFLCQGHTSPGVHQANSFCPSTASSSGISFQGAFPEHQVRTLLHTRLFLCFPLSQELGLTAGCSLVARLGLATEQVLSEVCWVIQGTCSATSGLSSQLPEPVYLKAKHQLHRGPTGQDAVIGMADEEEVQDTQEEHKGCGDPHMGGWRGQPRAWQPSHALRQLPPSSP